MFGIPVVAGRGVLRRSVSQVTKRAEISRHPHLAELSELQQYLPFLPNVGALLSQACLLGRTNRDANTCSESLARQFPAIDLRFADRVALRDTARVAAYEPDPTTHCPMHELQNPTDQSEVVIIGAGEQASIAHQYLEDDTAYRVVGFAVDDEFRVATSYRGLPLLAMSDLGEALNPKTTKVLVAISATQLNRDRRRLFDEVKTLGYECISYVSSSAFVAPDAKIGSNVFIFESNVLQTGVTVGDNVVMWSGNHVGHQSQIESDSFVTSHVVISGYCTIGKGSYLGVNATLVDGVSIGRESVVGAGAVILKDTNPRSVWVGNPGRDTGNDSYASFSVNEG